MVFGRPLFSGIVEHCSWVQSVKARGEDVVEIKVARPQDFQDLARGDSIAVNGICLTVEAFTIDDISFAIGPETLRVVGWTPESLQDLPVNLERAMLAQSRIHGHWVTGHVDGLGKVLAVRQLGETRELRIGFGQQFALWIWPKGSIAVQGVSLTINAVDEGWFSVCIIPETLRRTNLGLLQEGMSVNLEADTLAKGVAHVLSHLVQGRQGNELGRSPLS